MERKELIVKTKYEELYKTEYGYWIEHIEYEDESETVRFGGGGCSISNEVVDKLLDRAREEVLLELLEKKTNYKIEEVGHGYKVTQEYVLVSDIEKELSKLKSKQEWKRR